MMISRAGRWIRLSSQGFSLIELLVVIAIIAGMMGLVVSFFGSTFNVQVKKELSHLMGAIRFTYNEAITKNLPHRIVFDLNNQTYWIESSGEAFLLESSSTEKKEIKQKKESAKKEKEKKEDEESSPPAVLEFTLSDEVIRKVVLNKSVKFKDIYVSHQEGVVNEGLAYLYFFPKGLTEEAIIHLADKDDENSTFAIIVNPLTGHSRIVSKYVEYDKMFEK